MKQVIVVDDDNTNSSLIKMLLELDGFSVQTCEDQAKATAAATSETQAFVIDCHLARGRSGLDLLRAIRAGETNAAVNTAVIITSGDYRQEDESKASGADLFLLKPYPPDALSATINAILEMGAEDEQ
ncbi:MAG: response regulator transcription factor [Ardenticatenaceae bacterium]|nr:response regulator transcription factor [Ardenticatenaceae bacterium]